MPANSFLYRWQLHIVAIAYPQPFVILSYGLESASLEFYFNIFLEEVSGIGVEGVVARHGDSYKTSGRTIIFL